MRKKRKSVVRRARRSPYERSLEYATKRLESVFAEFEECKTRIDELGREIPYLQTVIKALTPAVKTNPVAKQFTPKDYIGPIVQIPVNGEVTIPFAGPDVSQEDFLADRVPGTELLP